MSLPVSIIPELLSLLVGIVSSFTFWRARSVVRRYAHINAELEKIEALEKASEELAEITRKAERDPNSEIFKDTQFIEELLDRLSGVVTADSVRLNSVNHTLSEVTDVLASEGFKPSKQNLGKIQDGLNRTQSFLSRRTAITDQIRENLERIKKALVHLNIDKL